MALAPQASTHARIDAILFTSRDMPHQATPLIMRGPRHVPNAAPTLHCYSSISNSDPVVWRLPLRENGHDQTYCTTTRSRNQN